MEKMKDITFPENAITKDFVEILYNENENEIRLYFPKEAMIIREIVKEAQFKFDWVALCWYTKITIRCPSVEDRMAEIANFLLNKGIPVYLKEKEIIEKAVTGEFEPSIKSIISNGFCYPVVTIYDSMQDKYIIIDGFHRYTIFKDYLKAKEIPIIVLNQNISERMEATVQFNRARGVHQTELMGNLVVELLKNGIDETAGAKKLGMELEEVLRLKQVKGVANFFKNEEYSNSWKII